MAIEILKRPYYHCFTGNPVHYELYSALAAGDATVSFEVKVRFKKIPDADYVDVVTLPYAPKDGYATIDLKEILDGLLEYDLPQFDVDETKIWQSNNQTGKFYLQFREITTVSPDPSWDDSELDYACFALKGGLNDFKYQGNNFWLNYFIPNNPFLTWQISGTRQLSDGSIERTRLAADNERMYLAWLGNTQAAGLSMIVKVYYTDGTNGTKTVGFPTSVKDVIYYLPVGCNQLSLKDIQPTKSIYYWTVQVIDVNDNTTYSELFNYELDNRNDYIAITINYRNSLGGLDSVRVRGSVEKKIEYNYTELEKTIEPDYFDGHFFSPQKTIVNNVEQLVYSGNLGQFGKEEQDRLRDAQLIRETWTARNKKWVPLNIITKNFSLLKNDDQRFPMPIEFTLGYTGSEYYTPDNIDLGEGIFTSNVCRAFISPLSLVKDDVDRWSILVGENDPQNASEQWRYRVIRNSDQAVFIDWQTVGYAFSPQIVVPDDTGFYTIEAQAICTNNIPGKITTAQLDTTTGGGGGGGGGSFNSIIVNDTSHSGDYDIDINAGWQTFTGYIGATNISQFDVPDAVPATITVTLTFVPPSVTVTSNGVSYPGTLSGFTWTFTGVDIIDGVVITID